MRPPGHFPGKKENPGTRKSVRRCETVSFRDANFFFRDAHFLLVDVATGVEFGRCLSFPSAF